MGSRNYQLPAIQLVHLSVKGIAGNLHDGIAYANCKFFVRSYDFNCDTMSEINDILYGGMEYGDNFGGR